MVAYMYDKGKACSFSNFSCTEMTKYIRHRWLTHEKPKGTGRLESLVLSLSLFNSAVRLH
jgi:hypothetical protein